MINNIKIILFISTFLFNYETKSQYAWPIDSNLQIVSNYGEIRPNHFHSGIDFSTNGTINKKLHSIESGFISRIKVIYSRLYQKYLDGVNITKLSWYDLNDIISK